MQTIPSLDTLLEHLRLRGIAVGAAELQRLQAVFGRAPALSRGELLGVLQTVLAKDDSQRRSIERVFESFVPFEGQETAGGAGESPAWQAHTTSFPVENSFEVGSLNNAVIKRRKTLRLLIFGFGILVVIVSVLLGWAYVKKTRQLPTSIIPESSGIIEISEMTEKSKNNLNSKSTLPFVDIPKVKEQLDNGLKLVGTLELWVPSITRIERSSPFNRLLSPLTLLLGAGFGLVWLLNQAIQRTHLRQPEPPLIRHKGKSFLPPLRSSPNYHLLSSAERREMRWGISHYFSDQLLNRLDIERSVKETAHSGLPSIHFCTTSRRVREVWLWQDQSSTNPNLSQLADEISGTLQAVNIQVQRGYFHGLPSQVVSPKGEIVWSIRHEYPESQPLVVVLCDNDSVIQMEAAYADEQYVTFRLLGYWANLCVIDGSLQPGALCCHLKPYDVECLLPQEVSGWLTRQGGRADTFENICPLDELHRWALACALPERPLMEAEIRALHEALRLDCAWQYHSLKRYARESGAGFDFAQERRGLLQEFAQLARVGNVDVARALAFWSRRYAEIERAMAAQETPARPWRDTKRQRLLELERALLGLWEKETPPSLPLSGEEQEGRSLGEVEGSLGVGGISVAAEKFYDLHSHADLRKDVEHKLGAYACLDWPAATTADDQWIRLPFRWNDLPAQTRKQLLTAGFGGKAQNLPLRLDKATGVWMGVLAGLCLAGLVESGRALLPQAVQVKLELNSAEPAEKIQYVRDGKLLLGTAKAGLLEQSVHEDEIVWVAWERKTRLAREIPPNPPFAKEGAKVFLWLAGENAKPKRPAVTGWPVVSVVVIAGSPDNPDVQRLAAKLLDNGTADQVLMGKDWRSHLADIKQQWQGLPNVQWVYVVQDDEGLPMEGEHIARLQMTPLELLEKLAKSGIQNADSLQAGATLKGRPSLLGFTPELASVELPHGMTLLPIPRGSFQMGSDNYQNEKPVRNINIGYDAWMSATEVTFAQYDKYVKAMKGNILPDDFGWGRDTRPVINVSWEDAQGYVQWLSDNNGKGLVCRLPTEAEWEYAARAGTITDYFWGNDIGKNHANCNGCGSELDGKKTTPVGSFAANAWGFHDMHGNVWEWVQDCWHNDYTNAPDDSISWESDGECGSRVIRGGSWYSNIDSLRSSFRNNDIPSIRNLNFGFRVLCLSL